MTHPIGTIARGLELAAEGCTATEIAGLLGVPRPTVRDWMHGRVPKRSRSAADGCEQCGGRHDLAGLPPAYVHLLGLYLGDGCLSPHPRDVFKLRVSLDARYPEIVEECREAIRTVMPGSKVNRVDKRTWFEVYSYSKSWPCLFPQHGPGKKHERPIVLAPWQWRLVSERPDLLLRGLLHSDGCRFQNTGRCGWRHPRYAFANASRDIQAIFCATCDFVGLRWTASGERTIYVSRKDDVEVLDLLVGPKR
jgi:hypothetical protein